MRRTKDRRPLGDLQLAIMQVLWTLEAATLRQIRTELGRKKPIAATTIATVLSRLEQAGMVTHEESERSRVYRPAIRCEDEQRSQARGLVDRLFGGRAAGLVAHLVRESAVDEQELGALSKLVRRRRLQ